jgi:hypothetical protein
VAADSPFAATMALSGDDEEEAGGTTRAFSPDEAAALFNMDNEASAQARPAAQPPIQQPQAPQPPAPSHPGVPAAPHSQPGFAPPVQGGYPPAPGSQPGFPMAQQPAAQPPPQQRPPMMSIGAIEIPPQPEGMSDSARLLLVFLGVGVVFALIFAAAALLVG